MARDFCSVLVGFAFVLGFASSVSSQSVSLDPSFGMPVPFTATASGFTPNCATSFQVLAPGDVGHRYVGNCPFVQGDPDASSNCEVEIDPSCDPGEHEVWVTCATFDPFEEATATYTLLEHFAFMTPSHGVAGTVVTVRGRRFSPTYTARVNWDGQEVAQAVPDLNGNFQVQFDAPAGFFGDHEVVAWNNGCARGPAAVAFSFDLQDPSDPQPPVGQISNTVGNVEIERADGERIVAVAGTTMFPNDTIETGADGAADILFVDNTTYKVGNDSRLTVDEFSYDAAEQSGSAFFSLLEGIFVYTSGLIGDNDRYIQGPFGVLGIRGTEFIVVADDPTMPEEIHLIDGQVALTPHVIAPESVFDAPLSIFWDIDGNITTAPLTQDDYDAMKAQIGPPCGDGDGDGVCDADDNCPSVANPDQGDNLGNGIGNACDPNCSPNGAGGYLCSPPGRDCSAAPMQESSAPLLLLLSLAAFAAWRSRLS